MEDGHREPLVYVETHDHMAFIQWLKESFQHLLLFASISLVLVLLLIDKLRRRKCNLPPSPPKLPIIGNYLHQLGKMPHLSLRNMAEKFGPLMYLQLGEVPTVVISSARVAKEALKTHDLSVSSRPQSFSAKQLIYGCTDIASSPYGAAY